ncbi:MAG: hypothetical protein JNJ60_11680, partial [Rhodocyclaceae bacterium]|nr:hypothetical protein [Rhodocyclaceae bacterium]
GGGSAGTFDNLGLLTQNAAGAHGMNANVTFNQSATVHVTAGSFVPNNGTDSGATYSMDAGTRVDYTSGTRTLSGSNTYNGAGSARLAGANWALSGAVSLGGAGSITLSAPFTLSGGAVTGTLTTSGATQISGSPQLAGGNWSNSGVLGIQGSGTLVFTNGGHFTNLAAGTVNLNSSAAEPVTYGGGSAGTFDNLGLLTQNAAGAHGMNANVTFNQSATVHVTAGSFVPNSGTDSGATYSMDAGARVDYTSGTRTLSGSNTYNGAGSARLAGANWALSGAVSLGGTSTLDLQSGAIGSGTLATSLAVQVSGSPVLNGTQWTNSATLDLTGAGTLVFTSGALLTNAAAATLTLDSSAATVFVYGGGAAGRVVNQGSLVQQAAGAHAVDANVAFDNLGNVQV